MARILVTGSAQGIGAQTARDLAALGHDVVVHGRTPERADAALAAVPGASAVVVGDFDSLASVRELASAARRAGPFDVVIHNAALGPDQPEPVTTVDGLERMLQINVVAPYVLTCLMPLAPRMVYIGSDAHRYGTVTFDSAASGWDGGQAYADSKLLLQMWVFELAASATHAAVNIVHPGWVRSAMGGPGAALPLEDGADTPVWMATSDDDLALGSGAFVHERAAEDVNPASLDQDARAAVVARLEELTGLVLPTS
ncbi:SDR family NAD(P)-dependent oxidoreductase [Demequina sp. NBRC 110056]|uniref:SDR family NAD(P)-dependent oxidoreductase n=1 Tax=Demequina sp. NBRC 110056 TaxID=1570345 RepID=UPI0009FDAA15|nr:SDR family NAD(P)-dependent oxidoreductase [Demequina sp. NBRC 110056]